MVIAEQMGQAPRRRSTDLLNAQLGNFGNQFVGTLQRKPAGLSGAYARLSLTIQFLGSD